MGWGGGSASKAFVTQESGPEFGSPALMDKPGVMSPIGDPSAGGKADRQIPEFTEQPF